MPIDKKKLHHWWRLARRIRLWLLVALIMTFSLVSAVALRQNNLGMVERRKAVLTADEQNGNVDASLKELRGYMMRHMNTRMGEPIQLQYSYERAVKQMVDNAAKSGSARDSAAYQRAQDECRSGNTVTYAQCVIDQTSQVAPGSDPITQIQPPPVELFSYQFYSPLWSPDIAGFAVLVLFLSLLILVIRVIAERIAWFLLRHNRA